jgi:hypothetical protein
LIGAARLEQRIAELSVMQPDDGMITTYARLRAGCQKIGHPLGDKLYDGDRWIAAAAVRLGCPVVSHDSVFREVPGLALITALDP